MFVPNNDNISLFLVASFMIHLMLVFAFKNDAINNHKLDLDLAKVSFSFSKKSEESKKKSNISKQNNSAIIEKKIVENDDKVIDSKIYRKEDPKQELQKKEIPYINNSDILGSKPSPIYPRRSLMLKQEGVVTLKALIDESGKILQIDIIKSSGFILLDDSALTTVSSWTFKPFYDNGVASKIWVKIPVEFMINK